MSERDPELLRRLADTLAFSGRNTCTTAPKASTAAKSVAVARVFMLYSARCGGVVPG